MQGWDAKRLYLWPREAVLTMTGGIAKQLVLTRTDRINHTWLGSQAVNMAVGGRSNCGRERNQVANIWVGFGVLAGGPGMAREG